MKLDRNINVDGRGKYALIKMRDAIVLDDIDGRISVQKSAVVFGGDDQFFVLKYKDKFTAAALEAYRAEVRREIDRLRTNFGGEFTQREIDSLKEYENEIEREVKIARDWPDRRIPD